MSIICKDGKTELHGSTLTLIQDFANVTAAIRATFRDGYSDETADELIALCGQLAYADGDDEKEKVAEIITRIGDTLMRP